jgi:plasmid stabilization system protein ParE
MPTVKQDSERAALQTVLKLVTKVKEQLAHYSGSRKPGRLYGTRELYFSDLPYLIVSMADADKVPVLAVFHTARHAPNP